MKKTNKTNSGDDLLKKALLEASRTKKATEEIIRAQLLESLAPSVRKMLNNSIAEMDDFDAPEDEEVMEEGSDEEIVDYEEEGVPAEEAPVEEVPAEDETLEEADSEEGMSSDEEQFLRELRSVLEADDSEDEAPVEEAPVEEVPAEEAPEEEIPAEDEKLEESEDADADDEEKLEESEDADADDEKKALVAENARLKKALTKIKNELSEQTLDFKRNEAFQKLVKENAFTGVQKVNILKQLDKATTEKGIKQVVENVTALLPSKKVATPAKKATLKSTQIKTLSENARPSKTLPTSSWADRVAELAGISK